MDNVGIIGYGAMGREFAERIRKTAGIDPMIYDIDQATCERAIADGLKVASSAAELGGLCDIIDVIVRTDDEMIAATIGPEGAAVNAKPGTVLLLHSSVLPKTTVTIAEAVLDRGIKVADAAASGTPDDIRQERLIFLLGANSELADQVRPHLLRMASEVLHMGPLGSGNVAKLMKNLINASERLVIWEALQAGEAAGISYVDSLNMLEIVCATHERVTERWREIFDASGDNLLPWCGTNLYDKDVPLAAKLASSYGLDLPVIAELAASAERLVNLNKGRQWPPA